MLILSLQVDQIFDDEPTSLKIDNNPQMNENKYILNKYQ